MAKRNRTRFVGAYSEPPAPAIDLPFTRANLRALLAEGARPDARYTHQQIKDWADRFWWTQSEQVVVQGGDVPAEIEAAADLAQEIEAQWDLYLANTYTPSELQHLDFSRVRLPQSWFTDWLARLDHLAPPMVSE
jgi:hypothetical protein